MLVLRLIYVEDEPARQMVHYFSDEAITETIANSQTRPEEDTAS